MLTIRVLSKSAGKPVRSPRRKRGLVMGLDDRLRNDAQHAEGRLKEAAGKATDNERLTTEGQKDQIAADAKQVGENVKDEFRKD